ncbi:response regulator [Ramlibacter sp. RBP-2]|uniref:Response regulator n=1 Tax=Ramlibacter lithotrophicus TaxID=2606681 RepID=A0A7X6DFT2_9BURK|nr:response regulator [Ramlibacter lithotrophicus]NKE66374.1 response regulator [Ramlibacter lithotrophicus]
MSTTETKPAVAFAASSLPPVSPQMPPADMLLGGAMFEPAPARPAPQPASPQPAGEPAPVLRLAVKGLKPIERQLLEGLVKVSQRRSPRLAILDAQAARDADVIVVDARDPAAVAWAQQRPWLAQRAVIWIDGAQAGPGHTLLRRPVQWPILPMVLARALERGPGTAATATPAAPQAARPTAAPSRTARILVVDDSLAVRVHLRSLLEARGYQIAEADSVAAAMARIEEGRFDCVLMDVLMPQVDGYEGCHRIKARLRGADALPVVMLTSKGSPFDRIRGKMAGCDAYLTKPVDPQHLGEVLAQQVGAGTARTAPAVPVRRIDPNAAR